MDGKDRSFLVPSRRLLRHLSQVALRNIDLSNEKRQSGTRASDLDSVETTWQSPSKKVPGIFNARSISKSSTDLTHMDDQGESWAETEFYKQFPPGKQRRMTNSQITGGTPYSRQRKLKEDSNPYLCETFYTISEIIKDSECEPLYISEIVARTSVSLRDNLSGRLIF